MAPLFGWHLDVASLTAAFASLPVFAKFAIKTAVAFPFTFHSINGIRHLVWDTGAGKASPKFLIFPEFRTNFLV